MRKFSIIVFILFFGSVIQSEAQTFDLRVIPNEDEDFTDMIYFNPNTVVGFHYLIGAVGGQAAVRCVRDDGTLLWTRVYGPENSRYTGVDLQFGSPGIPSGRLVLVGTVGATGNNARPDLIVTKILSNGNLVFNNLVETGSIAGSRRIAAEKICQGEDGECWVGFRRDIGTGQGNIDQLNLLKFANNGNLLNRIEDDITGDHDLRAMAYDRRNREVLVYHTQAFPNGTATHRLSSYNDTTPTTMATFNIPGPQGAFPVYSDMRNSDHNGGGEDVILAGGNSMLHFDNTTDLSMGQRVLTGASDITDIWVHENIIGGYCNATDQFFSHTYNNSNSQWANINAQPRGWMFQDNSNSNEISGFGAKLEWLPGGVVQWQGCIFSNEDSLEIYQAPITTMDDICNVNSSPIQSQWFPVAITSSTIQLLDSLPVGISNITGIDIQGNTSEPICCQDIVPVIETCDLMCGTVCSIVLTSAGSTLPTNSNVTYNWTISITGGPVVFNSGDPNAVFFPDANLAYTVCLEIASDCTSETVCQPLEYLCLLGNLEVEEDDQLASDEILLTKLKAEFKVFPNPSSGSFTIEQLGETDEPVNIQLVNIHGEMMKNFNSKSFGSSMQVDAQDLPAGVYLLNMSSSSGSVFKTTRIVIQ